MSRRRRASSPGRAGGFSLIELAIALLVLALLAGSLLPPLAALEDQRRRRDTEAVLADVREALYGFAASHPADDGRACLPCPDKRGEGGPGTANDGREDRDGQGCATADGNLPWADLGVGGEDAWGNRLRYAVAPAFSDRGHGLSFESRGELRICQQAACTATLAIAQAAVIVSCGGNGLGASSADEQENLDGDRDFVSHPPSAAGPGGFDDLVAWLSPSLLFSRMLAAGRLP